MSSTVTMGWEILDRMERAVAKVRDRLCATAVLNLAGIPYAVVGDHAVASWVTTIDEGAVRNTRDIDLLVRREDLAVITSALERAGFVGAEVLDVTIFLDGPAPSPATRSTCSLPGKKPRRAPISCSLPNDHRRSCRFSGHHARGFGPHEIAVESRQGSHSCDDLVGVGLIDRSWLGKLPSVLAERLRGILDTPDA